MSAAERVVPEARNASDELEELRAVARALLALLEDHPDNPIANVSTEHPLRQMRRIVPPTASRTESHVDRILRTASRDERARCAMAIEQGRRGVDILRPRFTAGTERG